MFTDIKGFSRRMGENERFTLKLLRDHNRIMRFLVRKHRGRIVKSTGDGYLMDFDSAVEAVQCAIEAQERFTRYNFDKPESDQIHVRIGISLGEVRIVDGDLFGDEVNIAARLQTLAEPSGICLTREVYEMVKTKLTFVAINFGPQELKNICQKVEVFKIPVKPLGQAAIEIASNRQETLQVSETQTFEPYLLPSGNAAQRRVTNKGKLWQPRQLFKPLVSRHSLRRALPLVALSMLVPALFLQPGHSPRGLSSATLASVQPGAADTLTQPAAASKTLLVSYFENRTGDDRDAWLVTGLTDMLVTDLQGTPGVQMLGRTILEEAAQANGVKKATGFTLSHARACARQTAADLLLFGGFVREGSRLRVDIQIFDSRSGALLLAEKAGGESVLALMTELTTNLKNKLVHLPAVPRPAN
ncbi:MAG: adenylate/guanylate cyclase domain-containing protein [candidate division KSB1 bacterium]|nr:adenylate/guanylate cyclase domain-containing protein [candidate division KSB1 bacterium]MDZ7275644.1 adenylate/guanylate cyclase domain-containing protein [candidate division KSB1 bacterium]MDZ7284665.1 adenylate/guanylate cyclase domain-containing protein [candidate division KSB1 bacterium]MDZ7297916.1 adenylate/guanylate cyclase domain-containing protein [candidate division KSB1 bacterium]MDZ7307119.1 adenylate/guanylate cyclase domain-containing protein [candidate division KSB1 bacterium